MDIVFGGRFGSAVSRPLKCITEGQRHKERKDGQCSVFLGKVGHKMSVAMGRVIGLPRNRVTEPQGCEGRTEPPHVNTHTRLRKINLS